MHIKRIFLINHKLLELFLLYCKQDINSTCHMLRRKHVLIHSIDSYDKFQYIRSIVASFKFTVNEFLIEPNIKEFFCVHLNDVKFLWLSKYLYLIYSTHKRPSAGRQTKWIRKNFSTLLESVKRNRCFRIQLKRKKKYFMR